MTDGFLNRWAKRKQDVREGKVLSDPLLEPKQQPVAAPKIAPADSAAVANLVDQRGTPNQPDMAQSPVATAPELPTLADTQNLTPESDFKPFMVRGVAADVKNAAMKKLFSDPHFNVMDRLDTYIDDYSLADPIPLEMLRQMASAKFLNLFDDEDSDKVEAVAQPISLESAPAPGLAAVDDPAHDDPALDTPARDDPARDDPDVQAAQAVAQSAPSMNPRTPYQP